MNAGYFDDLIEIEQDTIRSSQRWSRILLASGAVLLLIGAVAWILAALKKIDTELAPSLVAMVGLVTGAGSVLPHKEIAPRRSKIVRFKELKRECEKIADLSSEEGERRLKAINDFLSSL